MSAITAILLGRLTFHTLAPVPPDADAGPDGPRVHGHHGRHRGTDHRERRARNTRPHKAGLRAGDVIVRVGTLEPQNFDQVVAHICSFRPGAVVEIEVQRGDRAEDVQGEARQPPAGTRRAERYPRSNRFPSSRKPLTGDSTQPAARAGPLPRAGRFRFCFGNASRRVEYPTCPPHSLFRLIRILPEVPRHDGRSRRALSPSSLCFPRGRRVRGRRRVLREEDPPAPRRAVPEVPRGPEREGQGRAAAHVCATCFEGGDTGPAVVPGKPEKSLLVKAVRYTDENLKMPPKGKLSDAADRRPDEVGEGRGAWPGRGAGEPRRRSHGGPLFNARAEGVLGVPAREGAAGPAVAATPKRELRNPNRSTVRSREAGSRGAVTGRAGRPAHADPPRHVRPDRPAADARGGRRVPDRHVARRLREGGRPAARLAALRRALGPALARRGPLRRLQRARREHRVRQRLAVPRLRHHARSTPTSRTTASSASSSPATCCRDESRRRARTTG